MNKDIKNYIEKCLFNINDNDQNDFLDGYIEPSNEKYAKKDLILSGDQSLNEKESIYINVDEYKKNPYYSNIKLNNIKLNNFKYEEVIIDKYYLFNSDSIQDDQDRELKDYMKLRALDKDLNTFILYQDNKEWMMAVPSESHTNDPFSKKAHGKVITFGLGIGYFVYMALLNKKVESVTVVEKSKEVIELFNKHILPQFNNKNITIINDDGFNLFNKDYLSNYDYIYVDIWQSSDDGREIISKLLEQYNPNVEKCDFWIESSCLNIIRKLIIYYLYNSYNNNSIRIDKEYLTYYHKINNYFKDKKINFNSVDELKDFLYSKEVIRNILAYKKP